MEKRYVSIIGIVIIIVLAIIIFVYFNPEEPEPPQLSPDEENVIPESPGTEEPEVILEIVTYSSIFPKDAKVLIEDNPDIIIIDVSIKYNEGHIPDAINYPLNDGTLDAQIDSLDKNAEYLIYSRSDPEGRAAAQKLEDANFQHVSMIKGSYGLWLQSGYDYEKSFSISGFFVLDWMD